RVVECVEHVDPAVARLLVPGAVVVGAVVRIGVSAGLVGGLLDDGADLRIAQPGIGGEQQAGEARDVRRRGGGAVHQLEVFLVGGAGTRVAHAGPADRAAAVVVEAGAAIGVGGRP